MIPAWADGWSTSNSGSSKAPEKKTTGSWQPAQKRDAWTSPERSYALSRVCCTEKLYAGLLKELNRWALYAQRLWTSAWHSTQ